MTPTLSLLLLLTAEPQKVEAPVTQVTVFTDQARVVRTAQVSLNGAQELEFPALRDSVDVASLKVEANGAEVKRVDLSRIAPEKLRTTEAKKVLAELDALDTELERLGLERGALVTQADALHKLSVRAPESEPLKPSPKLNAAGWQAAGQFAPEQLARVQTKLRGIEKSVKQATERRQRVYEAAVKLGAPQLTPGWKVIAQVAGNGPATLTVTYLVRQAQWTPTWDLQLQPDTNQVNLSLAGLVTQSSGEDWTQATLLLSTAIPSHAVKVPKLPTWKIGVADRFIPTPTPMYSPIVPPPPVVTEPTVRSEEELLRARLARLGINTNLMPVRQAPMVESQPRSYDFASEEIDGDLVQPEADERPMPKKSAERYPGAPPPAPPPPPPSATRSRGQNAPAAMAESVTVSTTTGGFFAKEEAAMPVSTFSLSPPPAWRPPSYGMDSPVTLAAGYDLSFASLQKETVPSAGGTRRVALWSAQWPVTVERKLFPALTTDAFLVAELKNPSQQVLPGGPAQLYVGADPAGTARLKLVSPGEAFTLPLGIDRALKPVRNVQLVEATQGLISKDELGTYWRTPTPRPSRCVCSISGR